MDIFSVISLLGGLALFLYGMSMMSSGLEKMAGGRLESILKEMTSNKYKALGLGVGVTGVIQSSSAVTVMLVGLVNSGIMSLEQTVGVLMGSNIGTTVTAWILSLIGISSDNVWVRLLNPDSFSPILALIGVIMIMISKSTRKKDAGTVLVGFAILMYGMNFMSDSMEPLANSPSFANILMTFNNPIFGILAGLLVTAIIQSSSASVGILQALSLTSGLTYGMVIPIIMGQNIGTCVTALISSIGTSKNARRVAIMHITFNVIGTVVFLSLFYIINYFVGFTFLDSIVNPVGIAVVHSTFNVLTTILLLPFTNQLVKISRVIIKDAKEDEAPEFLDHLLLNTPSIAVQEASGKTSEMLRKSFDSVRDTLALSDDFNETGFKRIQEEELEIDYYEDQLGSFNVLLSQNELSDKDSIAVSTMLKTVIDAERISDRALNIAERIKELDDKNIYFSDAARAELNVLRDALVEVLEHTEKAYMEKNLYEAKLVEPLEEVIDDLVDEISENHVERLRRGACTIELGFMLHEIIGNMERISDHCSNLAVAQIELSENQLFTHEYITNLKQDDDNFFIERYKEFSDKYHLAKFAL